MNTKPRKLGIIGAGAVGTSFAFTLIQSGLVEEIVMVDPAREKLQGEISDLNHGLAFLPPVRVRAGEFKDCSDAAVVVITAGAAQKPGETRLDLTKKNVSIVRDIIEELKPVSPGQVLIMVTNPVDVLTWAAIRAGDFPPGTVIGSGTVLDSSRFRHFLASHCGVDTRYVHACVVGEHGDSEVCLWSWVNFSGIRLGDYCPACTRKCEGIDREEVERKVRESAYHVIQAKGATNWAVSLALLRIVEAIFRDENSILTVSVPAAGQYGLPDVCLSLPAIVNSRGAEQIIAGPMEEKEKERLFASADVLLKMREQIE